MSTEEQLVNCVRHTCGFVQTIFLFNLLNFFKGGLIQWDFSFTGD